MAYLDYDGLSNVKERLDEIYLREGNLSYRLDPLDGDIQINRLTTADETAASALSGFNIDVNVRTPDEMGVFHPGTGFVETAYAMANRLYLVWMSNGVLEIGLVRISVDVQTKAITYSALGHTSMAYGVAEVDTEWTIEALPDELPPATASTLGGVKVGNGLSVAADGTLSTLGLTLLEYGKSKWADFKSAYDANRIVYCLVTYGSGYRLAFMAWYESSKVEFQYYRSVNGHTAAQQSDEVYVYTLTSGNKWTTTVRQTNARVVAGSGLSSTYANNVLTINADGSSYELPPATTSTLGGVKVGDGLSVESDGTLSANGIADGSVTTDKLANGAVTTDKLANSVITSEKLAGAVVGSGNIKSGAVTRNKLDVALYNELSDIGYVATDATTQAVMANAGKTAVVIAPNAFGSSEESDNSRTRLCWFTMANGLEVAPIGYTADLEGVLTFYARGLHTMASGTMNDTAWTITALPTDVDGVSF